MPELHLAVVHLTSVGKKVGVGADVLSQITFQFKGARTYPALVSLEP